MTYCSVTCGSSWTVSAFRSTVWDLFRMFRADLKACGVSVEEARVCSARVLDDDFLAAGAARGYWELHGDGVRPVGWAAPTAGCQPEAAPEPAGRSDAPLPDPAAEVGQWAAQRVRLWLHGVVRWAAAVAAASMFWSGVVGCTGVVAAAVANGELLMAALAVPVVFLCVFAGAWIMRRFALAYGALSRPVVSVPGLFLSVALFFLLVA